MQNTLRYLACSLATILTFGCGGEHDGDDNTGDPQRDEEGFSSSLPTSVQLGALDEEQSQTLCEELGAYGFDSGFARDFVEYSCRVAGAVAAAAAGPATDAEARAACAPAYDDCIAQYLPAALVPEVDASDCSQQPASCTATVGEYSACVTEGVQAVHEVLELAPSCDMLTRDDLDLSGEVWAVATPLCDAVKQHCSSLPGPS